MSTVHILSNRAHQISLIVESIRAPFEEDSHEHLSILCMHAIQPTENLNIPTCYVGLHDRIFKERRKNSKRNPYPPTLT